MKKIILNLLFLSIAGMLTAQVDRSKMPEPGPAPKIELGETQSFTLENGLKVFVVENHKLPRVAFSLQLDRDPIVEGDKAGYIQMAGDLMSKGTKNMTKDEMNFAIDYIGASFFTSSQSVYAASLKKHQDKLLSIMSDVVKHPNFKEEELEKIRTQMISGLQTEKDDPDAIARKVRGVLIYGKEHPYGELMSEETVNNITLADAQSYYDTYFKPNISYLAVVGDIDLKEAKALVEKHFGDWKKGEVPTHKYEMPAPPKGTQVVFVNKPGAVQSVISVSNAISLKPGTPDVVKSAITNGILGGGFVSKLNLNLREAHSYTYGARSNISSDEVVGNFTASAKVRNEVTDSALVETMKELKNMRNGKITEDELETIKNFRTGTFAIGLESAQTRAQYAISIERFGMPKDYYSNYLKNVAAVTLDDVQSSAMKYIKPSSGYIIVVGNQDEVADKVKAFASGMQVKFYDSEGNEVDETTLKEVPAGVTAEKVLEDYITAIGGTKKLGKVQSLQQNVSVSMGGMNLAASSVHQLPNKYMSQMKMGEMVVQKQVFNGTKGQVTSQGQTNDMTAEELASMKIEAVPFAELAYLSNQLPLNLKGIDTKNEEEVYVLEVILPNDEKQTNFYSIATGLKVGEQSVEEGPAGSVVVMSTIGDYQDVKGVKYPFSVTQSFGPQVLEVKVKEIVVNGKVAEDAFKLN